MDDFNVCYSCLVWFQSVVSLSSMNQMFGEIVLNDFKVNKITLYDHDIVVRSPWIIPGYGMFALDDSNVRNSCPVWFQVRLVYSGWSKCLGRLPWMMTMFGKIAFPVCRMFTVDDSSMRYVYGGGFQYLVCLSWIVPMCGAFVKNHPNE